MKSQRKTDREGAPTDAFAAASAAIGIAIGIAAGTVPDHQDLLTMPWLANLLALLAATICTVVFVWRASRAPLLIRAAYLMLLGALVLALIAKSDPGAAQTAGTRADAQHLSVPRPPAP